MVVTHERHLQRLVGVWVVHLSPVLSKREIIGVGFAWLDLRLA